MSSFIFSSEPVDVKKVSTKYRKISTSIPIDGTKKILERLKKTESRSMHGQLPLVWDKAKDFSVFDSVGNCWIDFTSTIFVTNVGHSNPRVIEAIKKTLDNPLFSCYSYANELRAEYLELLIKFAGHNFEKAFLLSAGTEATEAAFKLMRMHGQKKNKRNNGIITIDGNWHGRTLGAQMLSSNLAQNKWIGYKDEFIHHIDFPYPWHLNNIDPVDFLKSSLIKLQQNGIDLEKDISGIMLETFQGWGAIFYPKDWVKEVKKICIKYNILLAFDEMQSGFGRTGKNFGFEHYEVNPDLICIGKAMGGGLPLSGVLGKAEVMDLPEVGNMSSTHSANPLVCAAGIAVIDEINSKNLVYESQIKGELLHSKLREINKKYPDRVSRIQGKGLLASINFKNEITDEADSEFTSRVAEKCMQKGLLVVHTGRESIKIGPPLTISNEALIEGLEVLEESIKENIYDD